MYQRLSLPASITKAYHYSYVAHGSFALVFPIHVLYLAITAGLDPRELIEDLTDVLRFQCGQERESSDPFPLKAFLKLLISMLLGMRKTVGSNGMRYSSIYLS